MLGRHQVIQGDCIEVMRGMEPDSVDAIVTDPPYGLEFMNKEWDGSNGFRRSLNPADIGRDNVFGRTSKRGPEYRAGHLFEEWCCEWATEALRVAKPGAYLLAAGSPRTYHRLACAVEDAGWVLIDCIQHLHGQGFPKGKGQLKPAYEPWTLARKPAPRVLPLQIDACRIGIEDGDDIYAKNPHTEGGFGHGDANIYGISDGAPPYKPSGRWPANIILGEEAAAGMDAMNGATSITGRRSARSREAHVDGTALFIDNHKSREYPGESGGASRFFYTPKASRSERGEGNIHPTVKPLALMRWLCKLVVPPGGICLDPFGGSGTTLLACEQEGFPSILIERETEYVNIIIRRYEQMTKQPALPEVG